jgi:hypothetical protein
MQVSAGCEHGFTESIRPLDKPILEVYPLRHSAQTSQEDSHLDGISSMT